MELLAQTYLGDILHLVAQALLIPDIVALLAFVLYGVWCIGSVLVELATSHQHFKVVVPDFLEQITRAQPDDLPRVVEASGLLGDQKRALLTLWDHRGLPVDAHVALAKRIVDEQESRLGAVISRTSTVSKVAPMLGLMGTLIPLGPGLVSLGQGDTLTLSSSLLIAFDTTVAGLVVSLVAFVITRVRKRWYDDYLSALEAAVTTILEKVQDLRESGLVVPGAAYDNPYVVLGSRRGGAAKSASRKDAGLGSGKASERPVR